MIKKIILTIFIIVSLMNWINYSFAWDPIDDAQWKKDQCIWCTDEALKMIDKEISDAKKNISSKWFEIWVNETIWVWFQVKKWDNTGNVLNRTLGTVIQKLMVALWVLAVLIMTIWAWYIIMYHGQDELLSKGKSIFMSGITALVVALSSYYLVAILRYILYK